MLQQVADFNDLSPSLLKKLQEKVDSFGKIVRYRFDIEQENPDKTFYNGKTIFPNIYTLDPTVFTITDKDEDRAGKSKSKKVALIKSHEPNGTGGYKTEFIKIRVPAAARGQLRLNLEDPEDVAKCMAIEMHPKLKGGMFEDKQRHGVMNRIDDVVEAKQQTAERNTKRLALNAVADMDESALIVFADGMQWDSTQNPDVLRNLAEELAEIDPAHFNDLMAGKKLEYRATIKQAIDREVITYDPATYGFSWAGNKQVITLLSPNGDGSEVDKFATFLETGGTKAEEAYKKIKQLVKEAKKPVTA